jgi:hypothetical protein
LCVNGGTGRGHKIFWLVPPTDKNLLLYEKWVKERTDKTEFFGDLAEGCCRLEIFGGKFAHHCEKLKTAFQLCYAQNLKNLRTLVFRKQGIDLKGTHARDFIVRFSPFYGIIQY